MLKQRPVIPKKKPLVQPPSGGCVLKHQLADMLLLNHNQPPSGGCVLKLESDYPTNQTIFQPPSGGCVLKRPLP